jgi:SAM-dependent MidA family methyltransferase
MDCVNLTEIIKNTIIQNQTPIGFDDFMQLALYYPKLGYYRAGQEKFGERGDFITAPETSDLFGFCLARQCNQVLNGNNDILEFGAGSGILAAQILFELGRLDNLPRVYYILEISAELRARQKTTLAKTLPELLDRVVFLDELPENFSGVVIANEVLDAMPAKRVICKNGVFSELGVDYQDQKITWQALKTPFKSQEWLPENMPNGYISEINECASAWVCSLSASLDTALVLLVDYGMGRDEYFHPQRQSGTLRCYYQHHMNENPFERIGEQDITTSVNFSSIALSAKKSGFKVLGYATQAMFLISLGIEEYLTQEKDSQQRAILAQELKHLVLPSAMGESFKVLALSKQIDIKCQGFKEQNLLYKL